MKKSPQSSKSDQSESLTPSFLEIQAHIFTAIEDGTLYIGQDKVEPALRSLLRDEAKNLQTMRLWEIMNASVLNEAYDLALRQSTDFDHVRFAKALKHWSFFMLNVIHILAKE